MPYTCLATEKFTSGEFHILPLRMEDRYDIMKWRNEQIFHLRQKSPLTIQQQDHYFETVISGLFSQEKPGQVLFSFFHNDVFVGYGGLVHINWEDKNAEISFLMNTELEQVHFEEYWMAFLELLSKPAFEELGLHKIYTYAYDLRPRLYDALKQASFRHEATLREHIYFDKKFVDVLIHSKFKDS